MKTDREAAEEYAEIYTPENNNQVQFGALLHAFEAGCKHKEESRWIPVTEKMPPLFSDKFGDSDYVLGHEEFGNQSVVCWYNYHTKEWRVAHYKADSLPIKITHWMPLPTPPQTNK